MCMLGLSTVSDSFHFIGCNHPSSSCHGISGMGIPLMGFAVSSSQDPSRQASDPRPVSLALAGEFFCHRPPGKPKHINPVPLSSLTSGGSCALPENSLETLFFLDLNHFINPTKSGPAWWHWKNAKCSNLPARKGVPGETLSTRPANMTPGLPRHFTPQSPADVPQVLASGALGQGHSVLPHWSHGPWVPLLQAHIHNGCPGAQALLGR